MKLLSVSCLSGSRVNTMSFTLVSSGNARVEIKRDLQLRKWIEGSIGNLENVVVQMRHRFRDLVYLQLEAGTIRHNGNHAVSRMSVVADIILQVMRRVRAHFVRRVPFALCLLLGFPPFDFLLQIALAPWRLIETEQAV